MRVARLVAALVLGAGGVVGALSLLDDGEDPARTGVALPDAAPDRGSSGPEARPSARAPVPLACSTGGQTVEGCPELLGEVSPVVPPVADLLLEVDRGALRAVEAATGRVRWTSSIPLAEVGRLVRALPLGEDLVVLLEDGVRLLDARTGEVAWFVPGPWSRLGVVEASDGAEAGVVVQGHGEVRVLLASDGTEAWAVPEPQLDEEPSGAVVVGATGTSLLLEAYASDGSAGRTVAFDRATGAVAWQRDRGDQPGGVAAITDQHVVVVSFEFGDSGVPEQRRLAVIDPVSGEERWDRTVAVVPGVNGSDALSLVAGALVLGTPDGLQAVDLASGELRWEQPAGVPYPPSRSGRLVRGLADPPDAPPLVVRRGSRMERLDPATGTVLWSVQVRDGPDRGSVAPTRILRVTGAGRDTRTVVHDLETGEELVGVTRDPMVVSVDPLVVLEDDALLRIG